MRPFSRELVHLVRGAIEVVAPDFVFWAIRRLDRDPEMVLLPQLCDPVRAAIDVGAHEGVYSHLMRRHAREVIAFEPNPRLARFLRRVTVGVQIEEVALSDRCGRAELRIPRYSYGHATMEAENTLAQLAARDEIRTVEVVARRLDDYAFADCGFIKIDVEGFESAVLAGARETILRHKPNLLVELEERHKRGVVAATTQLLSTWGYDGFYYHDGGLRRMSTFEVARHQAMENVGNARSYINNFIFAPQGTMCPGTPAS